MEEGPRAELEELHTKNQRWGGIESVFFKVVQSSVSVTVSDKRRVSHRLQSRLHEVVKQHNDLKTTSSHMERKVDELTEENGTLSVQVMTENQFWVLVYRA